MNKQLVYRWASALVSEFIEGCADAFLICTGGASAAAAAAQGGLPATLPTLTPKQILYTVLIGGAWYAASFLKKTPLPSAMPVPIEPAVLAVQPSAPLQS